MRAFSNFLLLSILLLFTGCLNNHIKAKEQNKQADSLNSFSANDSLFLADSNFVYKKLKSTANVKFYDKGTATFADLTFTKKYFQLSQKQAAFLIAPFLPKDYGVAYVKKDMWAWLVSKQQKIGDLQPIIVLEVGKADFEALALVILDKNHKPISEFFLDEGNSFNGNIGGQQTQNNYSTINKNEITSYRITRYTDSSKKKKTIDSNVFNSVIAANGTITTKQEGKSRLINRF